MRVQLRHTALHELILNDEGITSTGEVYSVIPDVLDDDSADNYEKIRTIVEVMKADYPLSARDDYSVFVFDDEGLLYFSGQL